jgi:hypothetical protein
VLALVLLETAVLGFQRRLALISSRRSLRFVVGNVGDDGAVGVSFIRSRPVPGVCPPMEHRVKHRQNEEGQ